MDELRHLIQIHPLIDNHCHNLLSSENAASYDKYPFESITSEAGLTALQNACKTLPHIRAVNQLAELYQCAPDWEEIKRVRRKLIENDYEGVVRQCLDGTQSLLLDDLLTADDVEPFHWHDRFTGSETKRIVRIEAIASQVLTDIARSRVTPIGEDVESDNSELIQFNDQFTMAIMSAIMDQTVVGFKSVICYRTGLGINREINWTLLSQSYSRVAGELNGISGYRVEDKPLNDWIVLRVLDMLQKAQKELGTAKPLQLHTGLGDSDIDLVHANPAYLQPVIESFPKVNFVLLHSSYPYTQQAGYLACVYPNVYLDLGEVFPMVSRDGQERILRDAFDITPTNRMLWSTDGHFFPETYWLSNKQFRQALEKV